MAERLNVPSLLLLTTPGEAYTSSAVPNSPSAPGFVDLALLMMARMSEPPLVEKWQVPHATVRVEESCSSQKSVLAKNAFVAVTGLPAGAAGGFKGLTGPAIVPPARVP